MVGSFDSFLIVFHGLEPLCVILMEVMTSSHLLLHHSVSLFPDYMMLRQNGFLNSCSCMLHIGFSISQFDWERILFDILLVCVSRC